MKISFDFDGTLARRKIRGIAWQLVKGGHDVFIITGRSEMDKNVAYVYEAAEFLELPTERIIFTDGQPKFMFLDGFDVHFDNNQSEIDLISGNLPHVACFLLNNYKSK